MNRTARAGWAAASILLAAVGIALGAAWLAGPAQAAVATGQDSYLSGDFFLPPYPSGADRMGVASGVSSYPAALSAGWYQDWGASASPAHPGGLEYARTIFFTVNTNRCGTGKIPASQRSQVSESITGTALLDNLRANPGALWIIGNEPDSLYDCSPIMPDLYADLYHEFYTFIRAADPSARIAIGGIVQPSPLRLAYLDEVLSHYQTAYGQHLPTDLWNIHLYAFQEIAGDASGAGVPPGAASATGWTYNWAQTVDLSVMRQDLRAMRQWMADRGQRGKPLIITEFGQVVPDDGSYTLSGLTFTPQVTRDYLLGSTGYFLTATDPALGDPADGNHLVQLWAWYSLNDPAYGGRLLNPDGSLTLAGQAFGQVAGTAFTSYIDLYPVPIVTPSLPSGASGPITLTLQVEIDNHGNATSGAAVPGEFRRYDASSGALEDSTAVTASQVYARYTLPQPRLSHSWVILPGTMQTLTFELDPGQTLPQARRTAQQLSFVVGYVPDLAVTALASDPGPVYRWGEPAPLTFTAMVGNLGYLTAPASSLHLTLLDAGGSPVRSASASVPPQAVGATAVVPVAVLVDAPGRYTAMAQVIPGAGLDLSPANDSIRLDVFAALDQSFLPIVGR